MSMKPDAIVQLSFAVQGVLGELAAEHELSLTPFRLLAILRDREPTMLDLARHLKLEKSSVTGLIERAEGRELVERFRGTEDRRAVHVRPPPAARRRGGRGAPAAGPRLAALLDVLPVGDRERLAELARAVLA